jgi:predicted transcriptional regulator
MARPRLDRPTNAELAILRVLWERGASTVREVHEAVARDEEVGYTTTLKLLQIMVEKRLAGRTEEGRLHRYWARVSESDTQRRMVADLVERVFGGSTAGLVMQALSSRTATPDELERIRALIDEAQSDEAHSHEADEERS